MMWFDGEGGNPLWVRPLFVRQIPTQFPYFCCIRDGEGNSCWGLTLFFLFFKFFSFSPLKEHKNTAKRYLRLAVETFSDFCAVVLFCVSVLLVYPGVGSFIPSWRRK